MCLTEKPTWEWTGSDLQTPVGMVVSACTVVIVKFLLLGPVG